MALLLRHTKVLYVGSAIVLGATVTRATVAAGKMGALRAAAAALASLDVAEVARAGIWDARH